MAVAVLFWSTASAQSEDTTELGRVVVNTGNILPTEASRTVHNVRLINAQTIERQGAYNLKELLSKENNIRIGNDNILGSSLSLQGISGQNVKILMDGIPVTGRENGNIDLSQINLNNIERIEIIEGPLSVIYGTDALGGVINLVSKNIMLDSAKPYMLSGTGYYESIGQYNFGGGGILKVKEVDFGATLNRNFFAGFNPGEDSRVMFWKPKEQLFGNFSITRQTGRVKVRFKTDVFNEKIENRGSPVINHLEAYAYDEYYHTSRSITSLHLEQKLNKKSFWNILSSFSFYQRDKVTFRKDLTQENNNMFPVPSPDANSSNSFLNFMSRGTYSNTASRIFGYQLGYDINLNSAFGNKIESDRGRMNDYALFACAEIKPFKSLNIKPGFRASYNTRYPAPFIPSIQLMYTGISNLSARFSYGRGFRAPGLKELYLYFVDYNHNIVGNPDLKSEISDNYNAALKYKLKLKRNLNVFLENSWFYNQIYHQIALVATNSTGIEYTYRNIDNFRSVGTTFSINTSYRGFKVNLGTTRLGINNNAFELIGNKRYIYSPEYRVQAGYTFRKGRLESTGISVFYKHNGRTLGYALDNLRNVVSTYSEAYSMLDVTANRPVWKKRISLTAGVKNILNVTNIRASNVSASFHNAGSNTMPVSVGRSVFLQMNVKI